MSRENGMREATGFPAELRRLRAARGLSLAQLSELTHYSKGYLSNIENGRKPATEALARRLDEALATGGILACLTSSRNRPAGPYQGLAAFETTDAAWFFGRERMTADLVDRVDSSDGLPLMVFGASGVGKSSLLRAGLAAAISDRPVVVTTPTADPVCSLAQTIATAFGVPVDDIRDSIGDGRWGSTLGTRPLVLIVDQFEEIYIQCRDETDRRAFIDALCAAALAGVRVVLGVRVDCYACCLKHPDLLRAVQDNQFVVGAMSRDDLVAAITKPARAAGLDLEPGLVETLLRDLGTFHAGMSYEPGALTLLSHALLTTWQQRSDSRLTMAGYQLAGGIHGAMTATAERVYAGLEPDAQHTVRRVVLRLVRLDDSGSTTRRRAERDALYVLPRGKEVVDALAAARLVTFDHDTVEITHDALVRAWPRLHGWLTELRVRHHLAEAAAIWDAEDCHQPGMLYRGQMLTLVQDMLLDTGEELTERERRFVTASQTVEAGEQRVVRRLRGLVALLSVLLVIAVIAFWYASST